jgi:hypothetical protein
MKLAELKKLEGKALLDAAIELHKENATLKKNSIAKEKYEESLSLNTTLTQDKITVEGELSSLKETTVSKEVFDQKVQEVNDLIQDKNNLESKVEELTNATVDVIPPSKTHFLVPGLLGEDLVGLICRSLEEKFIGESDITVFGGEGTPLVEALIVALKDETIPEEFVLITEPCVAINPFSMTDLKLLKCKKNGSFFTGLPVVLERSKLDLSEVETPEELMEVYFVENFEDQVPLRILDVGPDNLKCGVYRPNPRMDIVEDALVSKKFYCFNEKGIQALQPILDELYPTAEEEE